MKGREGMREYLEHYYKLGRADEINNFGPADIGGQKRWLLTMSEGWLIDIEKNLRSHGWHHESDVVEGKFACNWSQADEFCDAFIFGMCTFKGSCGNQRPATVGDLIKTREVGA